jgi:hypothetical protein
MVAKYYTRISFDRMATLLEYSVEVSYMENQSNYPNDEHLKNRIKLIKKIKILPTLYN